MYAVVAGRYSTLKKAIGIISSLITEAESFIHVEDSKKIKLQIKDCQIKPHKVYHQFFVGGARIIINANLICEQILNKIRII